MSTPLSYPMRISNKYYTVDIELFASDIALTVPTGIVDDVLVGAVILVIDSKKDDWETLLSDFWESSLMHFNPDVRVLVDSATEGAREAVSQWCMVRNFEQVEVDVLAQHTLPAELALYERRAMDGSAEKKGLERIKEALAMHMWPGMTMNSKPEDPCTFSSTGILANNESTHDHADLSYADANVDGILSNKGDGSKEDSTLASIPSSAERSAPGSETGINLAGLLDNLEVLQPVEDTVADGDLEEQIERFDDLMTQVQYSAQKKALIDNMIVYLRNKCSDISFSVTILINAADERNERVCCNIA